MAEHARPALETDNHDCEYKRGKPTCGGAFRCSSCRKLVGWCLGGCPDKTDPKGTMCNDCWSDADKRLESTNAK